MNHAVVVTSAAVVGFMALGCPRGETNDQPPEASSRGDALPEPSVLPSVAPLQNDGGSALEPACRPFCIPACTTSSAATQDSELPGLRSDEHIHQPLLKLSSATASQAGDALIRSRLTAERLRYESRSCVGSSPHCDRSLTIACIAAFASDTVVSIGCLEEYTLGGAHPVKDVFTVNFAIDKDVVKLVQLEDLFETSAVWRPELLRMYRASLRQRIDWLVGPGNPYAEVKDFGPFVVSCKGLHFVDTDLPFALGPVDSEVPWSVLGPWLSATGPAASLRQPQ